ncbi:YolD-like family protein [Paenibacillus sp. FSL R5-192]|uniref:YolD-like family protein n=1 Tax=Paenibacillus sp. FSL R5-192 TaxID=1226754 RepID=UPI00055C14AA|nr:YolD-like family protein [Paenibacillus sp. FSL R5-192]
MRSRLKDNGLYETSRMIMPEHREAWLAQCEQQKRRGKPELDDQEMQRISEVLVDSYNRSSTVDLILFNPFFEEPISGVVVGLNSARCEIKMMLEDEFRWVSLAEIVSVN